MICPTPLGVKVHSPPILHFGKLMCGGPQTIDNRRGNDPQLPVRGTVFFFFFFSGVPPTSAFQVLGGGGGGGGGPSSPLNLK